MDSQNTYAIRYKSVSKAYARGGQAAVNEVILDVVKGQCVVLLGPSGCGKTTLLKMTNRLIEPSGGSIEVDGRDVMQSNATELRRGLGYVIQQVGLFPHLTVASNVATVPRLLGWSKAHIKARTSELLEMVGLDPAIYLKRYPQQLSGGQQQRVGLARALAADPDILLMDEPFGAIDAITRTRLQDKLLDIQRRLRKTILFVTHDVDEALRLGDTLVVMRDGRVVQADPPAAVLAAPADEFVRRLLNTDDVLREMSVVRVAAILPNRTTTNSSQTLDYDASVRDALSRLLASGEQTINVLGHDGEPLGHISLDDIKAFASRGDPSPELVGTVSGS